MNKQLFLISSSKCEGGSYLAHCAEAIKAFLGTMQPNEQIAFIPYALKDHDGYTKVAQAAFKAMGYNLTSVHRFKNPDNLIRNHLIKAVFVGGGNTFRLLSTLQEKGLVGLIRGCVEEKGIKYIGSSAGSNMACPTIKTTNDMPIVQPRAFNALRLINFQINPHFVPGSLVPGHMGETREERIKQFHEENDTPVIGLTETNWLTVDGEKTVLHGKKEAFVFERGKELRMWPPETVLML
ncbi:MAG: dipeptidase PepE [Patescibacteria group bacterium]